MCHIVAWLKIVFYRTISSSAVIEVSKNGVEVIIRATLVCGCLVLRVSKRLALPRTLTHAGLPLPGPYHSIQSTASLFRCQRDSKNFVSDKVLWCFSSFQLSSENRSNIIILFSAWFFFTKRMPFIFRHANGYYKIAITKTQYAFLPFIHSSLCHTTRNFPIWKKAIIYKKHLTDCGFSINRYSFKHLWRFSSLLFINLIQNSSNPSSRENLDVRPYDRTTVQGVTFNMRGQLYRGARQRHGFVQ